jgi:hypothetical protein
MSRELRAFIALVLGFLFLATVAIIVFRVSPLTIHVERSIR